MQGYVKQVFAPDGENLLPNAPFGEPFGMKEQIKHWLKSHGRDREWLGQQLDTEVKTVHNWLSSARAIPAAKLALITRLMVDDEAAEARRKQQYDPVAQVFSLETDLATFRAYSQAAKHHQLTLEEWCISELNTAADQWFVDGKPTIHHTRCGTEESKDALGR